MSHYITCTYNGVVHVKPRNNVNLV